MSTLESAKEYVNRGFSVIPLKPMSKIPAIPTWKEYQNKRATEQELITWFGGGSQNNIGIITGAISGLAVVDLDSEEALAFAKTNFFLTPTVKTGRGYHLYYQHQDGVRNFQKRKNLPEIDLRGEGGYVVAPPSIHESGQKYEWVEGQGLDDLDLNELPIEVLRTKNDLSSRDFYNPTGTPAGERNNTIFLMALKLKKLGLSFEEARTRIIEASRDCKPPLDKGEALRTLESAWGYAQQENLTDLGNAKRLVRHFGGRAIYVPDFKKWYAWNGTYWEPDITGIIERFAKETITLMRKEALDLPEESRQKLLAHASKSEGYHKIRNMIELAKTEEGVPVLQALLDNDLFLLNVTNGSVDLMTGSLRPHQPEDYITKMAGAQFDSEAKCPTWNKFLEKIFAGDQDLIRYFQRLVGYCLTGDTREQVLFLAYGTGANGKSTASNIIMKLLGDYAMQSPTAAFMVKRDGSTPATNDIARLRGARFVAATEVEEGQRIAESLVKQLTGGDIITARFLYAEYFEFKPNSKLWLVGNHKPVIRGSDHAIWRRIHLIPFEVTIPKEEQDKELEQKLLSELSGILNWAIQGCIEWQKNGLVPPEKVVAATAEYREDMDIFEQWIEECCELEKQAETSAKLLYNSYKNWATENPGWVMSQTRFGRTLSDKGFKKNKRPAVFWSGIKLKTSREVF